MPSGLHPHREALLAGAYHLALRSICITDKLSFEQHERTLRCLRRTAQGTREFLHHQLCPSLSQDDAQYCHVHFPCACYGYGQMSRRRMPAACRTRSEVRHQAPRLLQRPSPVGAGRESALHRRRKLSILFGRHWTPGLPRRARSALHQEHRHRRVRHLRDMAACTVTRTRTRKGLAGARKDRSGFAVARCHISCGENNLLTASMLFSTLG